MYILYLCIIMYIYIYIYIDTYEIKLLAQLLLKLPCSFSTKCFSTNVT